MRRSPGCCSTASSRSATDGPSSRPATASVTLLPPVSQLEADVGPATIALHWSAHPAAHEVRVTRTSPGAPPRPGTGDRATAASCTGLTEGQAQHFEVTAVYRGLDGAELRSAAEQINATPRSEAQPIRKLRAAAGRGRRARSGSGCPGRRSTTRRCGSCVPTPRPRWQFGTWVSPEEMARVRPGGDRAARSGPARGRARGRTAARRAPSRAVLDRRHRHRRWAVRPWSASPTRCGIWSVTPFASYATVSWEWPPDGPARRAEPGRSTATPTAW